MKPWRRVGAMDRRNSAACELRHLETPSPGDALGQGTCFPIKTGCARVGTIRPGTGSQTFSTRLLARRNLRTSCSASSCGARRRLPPRARRICSRLYSPARMSAGNRPSVRARTCKGWPPVLAWAGGSFLSRVRSCSS